MFGRREERTLWFIFALIKDNVLHDEVTRREKNSAITCDRLLTAASLDCLS